MWQCICAVNHSDCDENNSLKNPGWGEILQFQKTQNFRVKGSVDTSFWMASEAQQVLLAAKYDPTSDDPKGE
jgi:hypothetical protein